MQYKNNSNVITQLLQKIRRVHRTAGMLWVWRRFPWSALAMGKGALRWMATASFFSRRQPCRDSMEFNVCQEAKNHSNSTKSLEYIANILIVKNFLLIKKKQDGHVSCRSCLLVNLLRNSWQILCVDTLQSVSVSFLWTQNHPVKLKKKKASYCKIISTHRSSYNLQLRASYLCLFGENKRVE